MNKSTTQMLIRDQEDPSVVESRKNQTQVSFAIQDKGGDGMLD